MAKHTAGPWHVEGANPPRIYARDGLDIIAQCDSMKEMPRGKEAANARLIAAAPELLEALQRAHQLIKEALPKFNWGASALDANAITLLDTVPGEVHAALAKALNVSHQEKI